MNDLVRAHAFLDLASRVARARRVDLELAEHDLVRAQKRTAVAHEALGRATLLLEDAVRLAAMTAPGEVAW